jgi:hypothetical protein
MSLRDHEPIVIEQFEGWWDRGDAESAPSDHFIQADNVQYFNSGVETRDPLQTYQNVTPLQNVLRAYNYVMQTGQSLLVLVTGGYIYHCIGATTIRGPILTIPEMEDFGFVAIAGRAYITPFKTYVDVNNHNYELGLQNQFLYVYNGDGTPARKAAGIPPENGGLKSMQAYNSRNTGVVTAGVHMIAVSYIGGILGPEIFPVVEAPGDRQIEVINIPPVPGGVTYRTIVMTKAINPKDYTANQRATGIKYYFVKQIDEVTTPGVTTIIIDVKDEDLTPDKEYTEGTPGAPSSGGHLLVSNTDTAGYCDFGFHIVGVVYETDTGYLTAPGPENFAAQSYVNTNRAVHVSNIPVSPNTYVRKRHLVSTKWIPEYNGDQKGYQFFFIPKGTLNDNTTTSMYVNYYDADLVDDASHLIDNFKEIPAGVNLTTYHSRMVLVGEYGTTESLEGIQAPQTDNRSIARVSFPGEPEAISKVDGIIVAPLDGNPLTNAQEFRDILYLFKQSRTYGYSDNSDEPATWTEEVVDQGVGAPVHGIGTVLDSGGVNVDFLVIADWSGLMVFNGTYARPEMSWKIEDYWLSMIRDNFKSVQLINDSLTKKIWMTLPAPFQHHILHADYGNGLNAKDIRWARWIFDAKMTSLCLTEANRLIVAGNEPGLSGIFFINPAKTTRHDSYYGGIEKKIPDPTIRLAYLGE